MWPKTPAAVVEERVQRGDAARHRDAHGIARRIHAEDANAVAGVALEQRAVVRPDVHRERPPAEAGHADEADRQ
jgi:hypothetical protein